MSVFLRVIAMTLGLLGFIPSLMLACFCNTREGLVFATAGMMLGGSLMAGCIAWEKASRRWWSAALGMLLGWCAFTGWLLMEAPDGKAPPDAKIQHRYVGGEWHFRPHVLGNLLPEQDQFALGLRLVPAVDSLFTTQQAHQLSGLMRTIYDELEADPAFHALGSVMPEAYDELWGRPFDRGHYELYVPPNLDRSKPQPALVFLHGSGGSFKAYAWLLSKVADRLGMVLIAPSFGMGNWTADNAPRVIRAALEDAGRVVRIDRQQVHLSGLSNGGLGVSHAAAVMGGDFRSLIFLSPVISARALSSSAFGEHWRGRAVLFISGTQDDRVPFDYVAGEGVATMRKQGAQVTLKAVEGANHFMFFSHREKVLAELEQWLRSQLNTSPS